MQQIYRKPFESAISDCLVKGSMFPCYVSIAVLSSRLLHQQHHTRQFQEVKLQGGGEQEALSLSVRLFLTAAISLIRLWRNRNLTVCCPSLPRHIFAHSLILCFLSPSLPPPHPPFIFFSSCDSLSILFFCCRNRQRYNKGAVGQRGMTHKDTKSSRGSVPPGSEFVQGTKAETEFTVWIRTANQRGGGAE